MKVCEGKEFTYVGNNSETIVRNHFVYDLKTKLVYCAMEKIGSTFWRRLFQILAGMSKAKSPFDIPPGAALGGGVKTFSEDTFDHIYAVLESSTKLVFTRDPYLRLLSGYVDKLFSPNLMFWNSIGKFTMTTIRKNASDLSLKCGHDVTFAEFVKYFIQSERTNFKRDGHFIPMYDHCRPCQVKFDIIGKMESFEEDTLYILKRFGFSELHDRLSMDFRNSTNIDSFRDQARIVIGSNVEGCMSYCEKQKRMWRKMQIRGTISKHSKFPFSGKQCEEITVDDYFNALIKAEGDVRDPVIAGKYRQEAVREAYSTVSEEDMKELQIIFKPDCEIFSYECNILDYKPEDGIAIEPFFFDTSTA
ncbi:hypothetical protein FSP39_011896 [Pinctada imbricata]|uniref:Carbohydrate sulfotransferase n=1 Tax=Pinctada imbricata TaxID=66713 RepID=A0AA88YCH6_PINIB|nr:hypothetical protein FSP39_011896 [Pinctada imbricata]